MKKKKTKTTKSVPNEQSLPTLDSQYGEIGISAVAAALCFKSEAKNPAYAPVTHQVEQERVSEMAA
jgi:hypothetical protein